MKDRLLLPLILFAALASTAAQPAAPGRPAAAGRPAAGPSDDSKPAAMRAYGLREAAPLSPTEIRVVLGAATTASADRADAWRILSDKDPAYAYTTFARPKSVRKIAQADEFPLPAGDASPKPAKHGALRAVAVAIELPSPMKDGATYTVVAHGSPSMQNLLVTGGRADASFTFKAGGPFAKAELPPPTREARDTAGLRGVRSVGGGIVRLECGAGLVPPACDSPSTYTVTVNGAPAAVQSVGRRTRIDLYKPEYWPFHVLLVHDIFLDLGTPLKTGDKVRVSVSPAAMASGATAEAELAFDERASLSDSIKANQVGYLPDAIKFARLGRWLGTMPKGALDFPSAPAFEVRDAATHVVAFSGMARQTHRRGEKDARPGDLSGENVWEMDFTKLTKPGRYYVAVPGVGRSFDFRIAPDAYAQAFAVAATGVVAQRCGIELKEPWFPWNRVSCHDKGIVPTTAGRGTPLRDLPGLAEPGAAKLDVRGGHHDAGDYNPRSHLDVAQALLDAYDVAPRKFRDGQMPVPPNERGDGIPDVVNESLWELRLWIGLQDSDGGVRAGTESNGDPNFFQTVELDTLGDYAFAKSAKASFEFAGCAAQCARILRSVGKRNAADGLLARARKAWEWAEANPSQNRGSDWVSARSYAAAHLLAATGEAAFNEAFVAETPWKGDPNAPAQKDNAWDLRAAAFAYVHCAPEKATDPAVRAAAKNAIVKDADGLINSVKNAAYPFIRHPWAPINWGTGAYENMLHPIVYAWAVTGDAKYRDWIVRNCDNTLGCNPMSIVWMAGLGGRRIHAPLHNSRYSPGGVVAGIECEGPVQKGDGYNWKETAVPAPRTDSASLYTFSDCHFAIGMDEGVVNAQAKTLAAFGLLLPDAPAKK